MMNKDKPLIRHCMNCRYSTEVEIEDFVSHTKYTYCLVKYKNIDFPRLCAKMCKFYEEEK